MRKAPNLRSEQILNKKFKIELSGYSAEEVDQFFDLMLEDYSLFETEIIDLENEIEEKFLVIKDKDAKIEKMQVELENLKSQIKQTFNTNTDIFNK